VHQLVEHPVAGLALKRVLLAVASHLTKLRLEPLPALVVAELFDELRSAVKSGYRNVSPLFNGLESAGNLVNGGLLRPVYKDSAVVLPDGITLNTNIQGFRL